MATPPSATDALLGGAGGVRLERMRFVAHVQVSLLTLSNALQFIGFANVVRDAQVFFDASAEQISALTGIYFVVFLVVSPFAAVLTQRRGLKASVALASALNFAAALVKLATAHWRPSLAAAFVGQGLSAVANCWSLSLPPVLAATWFGPDGRATATTLCTAADNFGLALGMALPPLILARVPRAAGSGADALRPAFVALTALQAAVSAVPCALLLVVPALPAHPPSLAAAAKRAVAASAAAADNNNDNNNSNGNNGGGSGSVADAVRALVRDVGRLARSPSLALLAAGAGAGVGGAWAVAPLLAQLLGPFGVSATDCGWMGFANITAGAVFAAVASAAVGGRPRALPRALVAVLAAAAALLAAVTVAAWRDTAAPLPALFGLYVVLGLAQGCAAPIGFEALAEAAFPLDEAVSGMLLMELGNVVGGALMLALPAAVLGNSPTQGDALTALGVLCVVAALGAVAAAVARPRCRRADFEEGCADAASAAADGSGAVVGAA